MTTEVLVIIFIVVLILSVLILLFTLVPAIIQLRLLLKDLERTSSEARELAARLKSVSGKVDEDIVKFDEILDSTKETMGTVKESLKFVNKRVLKQTAGILALIPAIKLGWELVKKFKRR
ncbi:MAG: hypothetical protein JSV88_19295 [Candidatus Aminicenantes bacterium]|nr:MAG: hypothetical protein JSV88_19295 [Candidatus Aminicenantes bacterium]